MNGNYQIRLRMGETLLVLDPDPDSDFDIKVRMRNGESVVVAPLKISSHTGSNGDLHVVATSGPDEYIHVQGMSHYTKMRAPVYAGPRPKWRSYVIFLNGDEIPGDETFDYPEDALMDLRGRIEYFRENDINIAAGKIAVEKSDRRLNTERET